jgi:hypothetical protein
MSYAKINLITPPDKLFNLIPGIFLIKPSNQLKIQFQEILAKLDEDLNVYIFDQNDFDITWLLDVSGQADFILIDIDNSDDLTKKFISFILAQPNAYYITSDSSTPWNLINRNRIFNLDWIVDKFKQEDDDATED